MKTIIISDEAAEFLKSLSHRMKTQDNRCTADPYYITIQKIVDRGVPSGCGEKSSWYHYDICESFDEESLKQYCEENDLDVDEFKDECTEYDVSEKEEYENFFLTYEGYEQHVKLNGHNIARECNSFHNYVQYASRNPELEMLYKCIHEIAEKL